MSFADKSDLINYPLTKEMNSFYFKRTSISWF
jgi:hypothetical protein